jgi:hypothetical protein
MDSTKPLSVPGGSDTFADIGAVEDSNMNSPLKSWVTAFATYFPKVNTL